MVVLDTGILGMGSEYFGAAADAGRGDGWRDFDFYDTNGDRFIDPQAGHGTFIAGIIDRLAPRAKLTVRSVLSSYGDGDECIITAAIRELVDKETDPGILNLSFGGYTRRNQTPMMLAAAIRDLQEKGWVVVASAGNDNSCRITWPAGLPDVISVASLAPGGPAWFTNYGTWVRACAPGVALVSRWFDFSPRPDGEESVAPDGEENAAPEAELARKRMLDEHNEQTLDEDAAKAAASCPDLSKTLMRDAETPANKARGWATWSGTSFSTPVVAGMLAREVDMAAESTTSIEATTSLADAQKAATAAAKQLRRSINGDEADESEAIDNDQNEAIDNELKEALEGAATALENAAAALAQATNEQDPNPKLSGAEAELRGAGESAENAKARADIHRDPRNALACEAVREVARVASAVRSARQAQTKVATSGEQALRLEDAVFRVIDDPHLFRLPQMGTVVNAHF